ncbi:PilC/PilY family type IV pilus protein [Acinetobacter sp. CFCC 10889]|uniref:PilC/PilY family type IV pilus protein n=1 Tax=Acinetobacter sp. CFCC 10889 TaxID=1775557 RepID=UPI001BC87895|nr:PilC/PilY family type IV pilus protein [Acinetobacter sp. CFCC 10889]
MKRTYLSHLLKVMMGSGFLFAAPSLLQVQASDLQIYAGPGTAGQKTLIMMLDRSGSMGVLADNSANHSIVADYPDIFTYQTCSSGVTGRTKYSTETVTDSVFTDISYTRTFCKQRNNPKPYYDRLSRLKDGMFALLNSTDPKLEAAFIGLGYYSAEDSVSGIIKVPAKALGGVNSAHRKDLKKAIAELYAGWSTPTSHAYAEAAAYLLGTTTVSTNVGGNSGFSKSIDTAKNSGKTAYSSPLPATAATCDGQGVYILSDGQPNNTTDTQSANIMAKALNQSSFSCDVSNGIANSNSSSGWKCMGAFARSLYAVSNPKQRPIQTAFVGFGKEFEGVMATSLTTDTRNACQLGSAKEGDDCSYYNTDKTEKPNTIFRNSTIGFGNGGFFQAKEAVDVTNSVLAALNNLDTGTIEPLTTGAWSVPIDDLNPTGVMPFGYVRAFQPRPGSTDVLWAGNLKKYDIVNGALAEGTSTTSPLVLNSRGKFNTGINDLWGTASADEGGSVYKGGAYKNIPMPTVNEPNKVRNLYTNFKLDDSNNLTTQLSSGASLLRLPEVANSTLATTITSLNENAVTSKFTNLLKRKILNYLGFKIDLNNTALPTDLTTVPLQERGKEWNSLGGISHSLPVQVTYAGELNSDGELQSARSQSILFGTMEGGLHLVDASTGVEQFAFIPSDILSDPLQSSALKKDESSITGVAVGTDAAWEVDPTYKYEKVGSGDTAVTRIAAEKMYAYGGLRMGGSSYYGLDITTKTSPKFLFRISSDQTNYSSMGQSWSKPVLGNIRINGAIKRVLFISGGYDTCYEDPRFKLGTDYTADTSKSAEYKTACSNKRTAKGNAVYVVDAETGDRLFWVSNTGADKNNADMKHSIVSNISTLDTDADGLVDHLYFGDLGGQIFRVDLNNKNKTANSESFGVRVVKIANLATNAAGTSITNGNNPRFYEAPTLTMHREQGKRFVLMTAASGDRSSPLDVAPLGRKRPSSVPTALTGQLANNLYAIMDTDVLKKDSNTNYAANYTLDIKDLTLGSLVQNPQVVVRNSGFTTLKNQLIPYVGTVVPTTRYGWYRSLSSNFAGTERANNTYRQLGGIKAFEPLIAITNTLVATVYDPESEIINPNPDPCQVRVIGETYRQYYCLPFGVCLSGTGANITINTTVENKTGYRPGQVSDQVTGETADPPIGAGILGSSFAPKDSNGDCGGLQLADNLQGTGEWKCIAQTKPMNWYIK